MKKLIALAFIALAAACNAQAPAPAAHQDQASGAIDVQGPWARVSPNGATVAAGYMTISNGTTSDDRLVSASSPRAARVEIHEMTMDGAVMQMRAVEGGLPITAGQSVALEPGGMHLMFMDITAPFVEGESIPVTLTFETSGVVEIALPVRTGVDVENHAEEHGED
ncbi:MAG: copper chaperone PCu(A)C [Hyphomonadaceae bacterium]|nr:copper chaperone PCu(A)C [Hyphomonadaceae bacterium]